MRGDDPAPAYGEKQVMKRLMNMGWLRKAGMFLLDIVLVILAVYLSMELRFEMYIPERHMHTMFKALPMVVVVYMACYIVGGIYQIMWRYAGVRDVARLCVFSAIACGATLAINQFFSLELFRSVLILTALLAMIAIGGSRMIWRVCSKDRISGELGDAHAGDGCRRGRSGCLCRQYLQQKPQTYGQAGHSGG